MTSKEPTTTFEPEKPIVPDGWDVLPFQKAATVVSDQGKRVKQSTYSETGKIPVVDQGQDYIGGYIDDETMAYDGELPVILFGDHTRSIKFVDKRFAVGAEGIKILKPADGYNPKFFYYLLRSLQIPSRGYSRHFQFLKKFYFPIAPPEDQKRIVAEIEKQFSRLDEAVANLKRVKANIKRYKAAVISKVTSQTWPHHTIETLLAEPLRNGHSAKAAQVEHGVPTFTLSAVTNHDFSDRNIKMTNADKGRVKDLWVKDGDLFVERSNTPELVGTASLYCGQDNRAIFPDLLIRVRVNKEADPRWIEICLQSERIRRYFRSRAQGISGTMPKIDQQTIADAKVPLPSLREQEQLVADIDRQLSLARDVELQVDINLKRASTLRQSILTVSFNPQGAKSGVTA